MEIIDISWPISAGMTFYKDRKNYTLLQVKNIKEHNVAESEVTLGSHVGTHVDAPAHFIAGGVSIDKLPLTSMVGEAAVVVLPESVEIITADVLKEHVSHDVPEILLLKTKNSNRTTTDAFDYNFAYVAESGAQWLAEKKVKAIGIDYLGIERMQPDHETHTILMQNNIPIIEGLRLQHVHEGHYFFVCLPLNIIGCDAAPARAILIKQ